MAAGGPQAGGLTHCPALGAEYDGRSTLVPRPASTRRASSLLAVAGAALIGAQVLNRRSEEGSVPGAAARVFRTRPGFKFSQAVRYDGYERGSAPRPAVVAPLLDAASHGPDGRRRLPCPSALRRPRLLFHRVSRRGQP